MSEQQFSPGPWKRVRLYDGKILIVDDTDCHVAEIDPDEWSQEEQPHVPEANARLIAAAPDM